MPREAGTAASNTRRGQRSTPASNTRSHTSIFRSQTTQAAKDVKSHRRHHQRRYQDTSLRTQITGTPQWSNTSCFPKQSQAHHGHVRKEFPDAQQQRSDYNPFASEVGTITQSDFSPTESGSHLSSPETLQEQFSSNRSFSVSEAKTLTSTPWQKEF